MTRMRIPPDSRWFDGHFDGAPILPGIAHIALAVEACANRARLRAIRDVRFNKPILPNDEIEIDVSGEREVRFTIRCGGAIATSGVLEFEA